MLPFKDRTKEEEVGGGANNGPGFGNAEVRFSVEQGARMSFRTVAIPAWGWGWPSCPRAHSAPTILLPPLPADALDVARKHSGPCLCSLGQRGEDSYPGYSWAGRTDICLALATAGICLCPGGSVLRCGGGGGDCGAGAGVRGGCHHQ